MARLTSIRERVHMPFWDTLTRPPTFRELVVRLYGVEQGSRILGDNDLRERTRTMLRLGGYEWRRDVTP